LKWQEQGAVAGVDTAKQAGVEKLEVEQASKSQRSQEVCSPLSWDAGALVLIMNGLAALESSQAFVAQD
jgi:hypothetical protein